VVITSAFFLVPFAVLMWGMFAAGYTPQYAACAGHPRRCVLLLFNDFRASLDAPQILGASGTPCRDGGRRSR
jgi:TRAP-type uncharacterized transport system fused permease subunit